MFPFVQDLFADSSIWLVFFVSVFVLGTAGIIIYQYSFEETKKNNELPDSHITFSYVAIGAALLVSFLAVWVIFCPPFGVSEEAVFAIQKKNPKKKAIMVLVICALALYTSINLLVQRYNKPNELAKEIDTTEFWLVVASFIISIAIVLYAIFNKYIETDIMSQQQIQSQAQQRIGFQSGQFSGGMY